MIYRTFRLFFGDFRAPMDLRLLPDCSFSSSLGTIVLVSPKSMWTSGLQVRKDIGPNTQAINNSPVSHSRSCKYSLSRFLNSISSLMGLWPKPSLIILTPWQQESNDPNSAEHQISGCMLRWVRIFLLCWPLLVIWIKESSHPAPVEFMQMETHSHGSIFSRVLTYTPRNCIRPEIVCAPKLLRPEIVYAPKFLRHRDNFGKPGYFFPWAIYQVTITRDDDSEQDDEQNGGLWILQAVQLPRVSCIDCFIPTLNWNLEPPSPLPPCIKRGSIVLIRIERALAWIRQFPVNDE